MEAIMVGTLDGVFKVTRSNGNWQIAAQSLNGMEANALAAHPRRREVVYAGIRGGGVFSTDDAGKTWRRLGEGVLSDKIRALALDPSRPENVYVGTEPPALWKSADGGVSWKELPGVSHLAEKRGWTYPVPVIQPHIRSIAIDPSEPNRLCLAAQVGGVLLSEDGGESWTDVRTPSTWTCIALPSIGPRTACSTRRPVAVKIFLIRRHRPRAGRFTVRGTAASHGNRSRI
jgi:hypothetical protein